jgi:hypothetical protein
MRTVKATAMNDVSSRSHAIFQLIFTQIKVTRQGDEEVRTERVSRISMVDLAGSERSGQINAGRGERLKEGNVINQSLSTLGKVISTLAERGKAKKAIHVPYRESTLTWLLKDSLGGNSKTVMLAAISPAGDNYEETLSTLRYANQAKNIVNKAVVNEDATATMVRKLNEEIEALRKQLEMAHVGGALPTADARGSGSGPDGLPLGPEGSDYMSVEDLEESERLMDNLTRSWEDKLVATMEMQAQRAEALRQHGILINEGEDTPVGVMAPRSTPYLLKLSAGGSAGECLVYYLKEGLTVVVQRGTTFEADEDEEEPLRLIELDGTAIEAEHCEFHCVNLEGETMVSLVPLDAEAIKVNDRYINKPLRLKAGDIIHLSDAHVYRYDNPEEPQAYIPLPPSATMRGVAPNRAAPAGLMPAPPGFEPHTPQDPDSGGGGNDAASSFGGSSSTMDDDDGLSSAADASETSNGSGSGSPAMRARLSEARAEAKFEYTPADEDKLLSALITDTQPQHTHFKLLPAYGVYLMCRHCQSEPHGARMSELLEKVAMLVSMNVMNASDVATLAFWLANASEMSMALRSDYTLAAFGCAGPQQKLAETAQEAFAQMLSEVKKRLRPGIPALLSDTSALAANGMGGLLGSPAGSESRRASLTGGAGSGRSSVSGPVDDPAVANVHYILDTLEAVHRVARGCLVSAGITSQLFQSIYYFIGAEAFNVFISDTNMFRCDKGLVIRYNLSLLTEWAAKHGLKVERHLRHITQASQLLQAQKVSLQYLDMICDACADLNSLQVEKILRHYRPGTDEEAVPVTLIDCVKGRFLASMDPQVQEDESVGNRVQLNRNPDFLLPFRLSGETHMSRRLVRESRGGVGLRGCVGLQRG